MKFWSVSECLGRKVVLLFSPLLACWRGHRRLAFWRGFLETWSSSLDDDAWRQVWKLEGRLERDRDDFCLNICQL